MTARKSARRHSMHHSRWHAAAGTAADARGGCVVEPRGMRAVRRLSLPGPSLWPLRSASLSAEMSELLVHKELAVVIDEAGMM